MSRLARIESGKSFGTRVTFILPHGRYELHLLLETTRSDARVNSEASSMHYSRDLL